jgi:DNA-binding IclR family transcriptional regulator
MSEKLFSLQREKSLEENLRALAQPVMEKLSANCRETVNLGTLDGGEIVVIATVESPQSIRMASKVGNRRHIHTTALGKMLLAGKEEKEIRRLMQMRGLPRCTPKSIVTQTTLLAELKTTRRQGYAIDNQENEMDGRCIACPIEGPTGNYVAALSISGPAFRMDLQRLRSLRPMLEESCRSLSRALRS